MFRLSFFPKPRNPGGLLPAVEAPRKGCSQVPESPSVLRSAELGLRLNLLESRLLYSAVPLPGMEPVHGGEPEHASGDAGAEAFANPVTHLILLDARLENLGQLADELSALRPEASVVMLPDDGSALDSLEAVLSRYHDLERLELFSHGDVEGLELGRERILLQDSNAMQRLARAAQAAMVEGGDLLLYGCDLAATPESASRLEWFAEFTGLDLFASIDATGSTELGGDWDLEFRSSGIAEDQPLPDLKWHGLLGVGIGSDVLGGDQQTSARDRGSHKSIAVQDDGSFVMVWTDELGDGDGTSVYARRFGSDGNPLAPAFQVNQYTNGDQRWASVAMDQVGNFVVVWSDPRDSGDIYARRFNASGNPLGNEFQVNTSNSNLQYNATLAMADNGAFVVAWEGEGTGDSYGIFAQRFDANGTKLGGEFRVNTSSSGSQYDPSVSINASGDFAVSWDDANGFHVRRYNANGTPDGAVLTASTNSTSGNGSILLNNDGSLVVAWRTTVLGTIGTFVRIHDPVENSFGIPILVSPVTSLDHTNPSVDGDGSGEFVITWHGEATDGDQQVFARRFNANGSYASGLIQVSPDSADSHSMAAVAVVDPNHYVVAWTGDSNGDQSVYFATFGHPTGTDQTFVLTEDSSRTIAIADFGFGGAGGNSLQSVQIDSIAGGSLMLGAERLAPGAVVSRADILAGRLVFLPLANRSGNDAATIGFFVNDGLLSSEQSNQLTFDITPVADPMTVSGGDRFVADAAPGLVNPSLSGTEANPHIANLSGGGRVVVWESTDGNPANGDYGTRVFAEIRNSAGQPLGLPLLVDASTAGTQTQPKVTGLADGGFLVVWEGGPTTNRDIHAQRFDHQGNRLTLTGSPQPTAGGTLINQFTAGHQADVDVAAHRGGFVVTWSTRDPGIVSAASSGIVARYFTLTGESSAEFQVNQQDVGNQRNPRVTVLADDRILISWVDQGGDGFDVHARLMDFGRVPTVNEFVVNSHTALRQAAPQSASLGEHGFVIVWHSQDQDGSGLGVFGRRFDLAGNPLDSTDFQINSSVAGDQTTPEVIGFADGSFLVQWQGAESDGDNYGIVSRRFAADGQPLGQETLVNGSRAGRQANVESILTPDGRIESVWMTTPTHAVVPGFASVIVQGELRQEQSGVEDTPLPLNLSLASLDHDGSESITAIRLLQIPASAVVSDGVRSFVSPAGGSLDLAGWDLRHLTLTPPANATGEFELLLQVTSLDGSVSRTSTSTLMVRVAPVNDAIDKSGFSIHTTVDQPASIPSATVFTGMDDPDQRVAAPLTVTPFREYTVSSSSPAPLAGPLSWLPVATGAPILLDGSGTSLSPVGSGTAGDIDWTYHLDGSTAGTLDLANWSGLTRGIELWVRPDQLTQSALLFEWGGANHGIAIYQDGHQIRAVYASPGSNAGGSLPSLELAGGRLLGSDFNQVVLVIDGAGGLAGQAGLPDLALFVNGERVDWLADLAGLPAMTPSMVTSLAGASELTAGIGGASGTAVTSLHTATAGRFSGDLARVALFNTAVNADEVAARHTEIRQEIRLASIGSTALNGPTTVSLASGALVHYLADGSFVYDPNGRFDHLLYGQSATDSFSYQLVDNFGLSTTVPVTVNIEQLFNRPPSAGNDSFDILEDSLLDASVGGNDSDLESDPLNWQLATGPQHGNLVFRPDGSFRYTPDADFHGLDGFTYTITDGSGTTGPVPVVIRIDPVNDAPTTVNGTLVAVEDVTLVGSTSAWGTDVDGDVLQWSLVSGPVNGTMVLNPDGTFSYQPGTNFHGTDSFRIRAHDGLAASEVATITIAVQAVNDAPIAQADSYSTRQNVELRVPVIAGLLANDSDPENQSLTVRLISGPAHGTLTLGTDGSFRYLAHNGFTGVDQFSYVARDGQLESTPTTVSILVESPNLLPEGNPDTYTLTEGETLRVQSPGVLANDSDGNSDPLTVELVRSTSNGRLTLAADGSFTYQPNSFFSGTDSFRYRIRDGFGVSGDVEVTLLVAEAPKPPPPPPPVKPNPPASNSGNPAENSGDSGSGSTPDVAGGGDAGTGPLPDAPVASPDAGQAAVRSRSSDADVTESDSEWSETTPRSDIAPPVRVELTIPVSVRDRSAQELVVTDPGARRELSAMDPWNEQVIEPWFEDYLRELGSNREDLLQGLQFEAPAAVSTAAGLIAVGYLTFAFKSGGALLSAFVSSMPAWQSFDPLPVLEGSNRSAEEDDTSIEQMVDA